MAGGTERARQGLGWKRQVVLGALALLTLWPPLQIWLVHQYDVSPWKLAGWGMYASPRPNFVGLEVYGTDAAGVVSKVAATVELRDLANDFLSRWKWLGGLVGRPDELVKAARRQRPDWHNIRVVASKPVMNRATMTMEMRNQTFAYP